ncbi:unnamed protein product (macronuclear) [Paramecium tetraurelia]|uniref:Uncharacterized protein n=1 Tax=Paramecium tetraurelia TaxID=5888 RepID=A0DCY3_PARTE|nr:uncharacterized protein GSPATT00015759001 [Paramecium tetraurelia]CAK80900.1 unnamed protein product [Paramecium tetraurelia]|eukprot:XP_001448297.1 hypothetical protein (macronuclear) [Paramecium tetraurelia strain d4-2]
MKLFKAFCQGKSILLKDTEKLTKYFDLCLKTPITYNGIKQSIGYQQIMVAQFNSKEFNKGIFPQFISLIGRDFKELDQQEFNQFIQSLSCYVESALNKNVYDKQILENVLNQIGLNATYIQKSQFYITTLSNSGFLKVLHQSIEASIKFQNELFKQAPQTAEEFLWRLFIVIQQLQWRKKEQGHKEIFQNVEHQIMESFINQIEKIETIQPKLTNILSRFMLLKYYMMLKHQYPQFEDKRIQKYLFSNYLNSHNYILENLSSLNSFEFLQYIDIFSKSKDLTAKWDLILNEINSRNLNEMPIYDVVSLTVNIMDNKKMTPQIGNRLIQHLYENADSINPQSYAELFKALHYMNINQGLKEQFLTKIQQKVVPKDLPLHHVSIILFVLKSFKKIDQNIIEKYLVGIQNRIKDIDNYSAMGILAALNSVSQKNPLIFAQIQTLKLNEQQDQLLLVEILRYIQLHDPQNEMSIKVQEAFVKHFNKEANIVSILQILEILRQFDQKTQKKITLIPELKKHIKRGVEEFTGFISAKKNDNEQMEFLRKNYQIDV